MVLTKEQLAFKQVVSANVMANQLRLAVAAALTGLDFGLEPEKVKEIRDALLVIMLKVERETIEANRV